jgi:hypothetical protein
MAKKAKKNASNQSSGSLQTQQEERGIDLSTAAEMWTEEELRAMIREEALKLIGQTHVPNITAVPNTQPYATGQWQGYPTWVQPINVSTGSAGSNTGSNIYDPKDFKVTYSNTPMVTC